MSNATNSYESAAKDIEQEKKVVAALKRLSIGNMMNYDPDLPVDETEFQFNQDIQSELFQRSDSPEKLSRNNSVKSFSSSISKKSDNSQAESVFFDAEDDDSILETSADSLLWVPANLHPEVDPEQFKLHVKTKVEEMMERKVTRKKTLSRRSSLSTHSTVPKTPGQNNENPSQEDNENSINTPHNRFSNPSLRDLTDELEKLSNLAGMNANDAVTLARTLSTTSLGYTDVERQAFDEIKSPPHVSPTSSQKKAIYSDHGENFVDPESPNPMNPLRNQGMMQMDNSIPEFALKRSRRLDYRKNTASNLMTNSLLGSNLQNNKHDKLMELRNSLNSSTAHEVSAPLSKVPKKRYPRKVRDSQMLFSYRNPNDNNSSSTLSSTNGSPYPSSGSNILLDKIQPGNKTYKTAVRNSRQGFSGENHLDGMRRQKHHRPEKIYSQQPPPNQPVHEGLRQHKYHQRDNNIPVAYASDGRHHHRGNHDNSYHSFTNKVNFAAKKNRNNNNQEAKSRINKHSEISELPSSSKKSNQLSQNLDLLRSEIHEFKEILSGKTEDAKDTSDLLNKDKPYNNHSVDGNDLDISFENSYQDLSYEDSLGLDKEIPNSDESKAMEYEVNTRNVLNDDDFEEKLEADHITQQQPKIEEMLNTLDLNSQNNESTELNSNETNEASQFNENHVSAPEIISSIVQEKKSNISVFEDLSAENILPRKISIVSNEVTKNDSNEKINQTSAKPYNMDSYVSKSESELSDQSSLEISPKKRGKKDFGRLKNMNAIPINSGIIENGKKGLKKKKSWQWLRERSSSLSSVDSGSLPAVPESDQPSGPARSVSSPEVSQRDEEVLKTKSSKNIDSKENMITKLFRKKKTPSTTKIEEKPSEKVTVHSDPKVSKNILKKKKSSIIFKPNNRNSPHEENDEENTDEILASVKADKEPTRDSNDDDNLTSMEVHADSNTTDLQESEPTDQTTIPTTDTVEAAKVSEIDDHSLNINDAESKKFQQTISQATLEIQEKLRKSIKRTSKANQPIQFTDSAFGFPLPPPSTSTLTMLEYRFPVHVERAIYRLSHLKLANPKRSLKEQVLLSNFMYAYLNLVDHTLHLEQRQNNESDMEIEKDISNEDEQDIQQNFHSEEFVPVLDENEKAPETNVTAEIVIDLDADKVGHVLET